MRCLMGFFNSKDYVRRTEIANRLDERILEPFCDRPLRSPSLISAVRPSLEERRLTNTWGPIPPPYAIVL